MALSSQHRPAAARRTGRTARRLAAALAVAGAVAGGAQPPAAPPTTPATAVAAPAAPRELAVLTRSRPLRGLRLDVVAPLLRGESRGEIAVALLAVPVAPADSALVVLEVDGASFLGANTAAVAPVELYAYLLRPDGSVAAYFAEAFVVDVDAAGQAIWNSGLKIVGRLPVTPGEYSLRAMVRNPSSGARGFAAAPLRVLEPSAGGPGTARSARTAAPPPPPLFADPGARDGWQLVLGASLADGEGLAALTEAPPAARPVLISGRQGRGFVAGSLPPGAAWLELVDATGGRTLERLRIQLEAEERRGRRTFTFEVPELPGGTYGARLAFTGAAGTRASDAVPVLLTSAPTQDRDLLWSDVRWLAAGGRPGGDPAATAAPEPGRRAARRRRTRRLERDYAAVLATLAEEGPGEARSALFELESRTLAGSGRQTLADLLEAQVELARRLAELDPELIAALVALHEENHGLYLGRRLFSLVAHNRLVRERLAEVHAAAGGAPELTAVELASLGGHYQEAYLPAGSRRLFERALQHDPASAAALLGLALSHEKYGEYPEAVARLEKLAAARPALREARLRLAVNLERIGDRRRLRPTLEQLAADGAGDWIAALAHQELGRLLLRLGASDEAAEVLVRGVERIPGSQALRVLLAHVYDRQGRPAEALTLVDAVGGGAAADSERLIYDRWESSPLRAARRALADAAAAARPRLAEALAGVGEEAR